MPEKSSAAPLSKIKIFKLLTWLGLRVGSGGRHSIFVPLFLFAFLLKNHVLAGAAQEILQV